MRIVIAGRYHIGVRVLEHLRAAGHDVPAVVVPPSDLERSWQPSLADAAQASGVPVFVRNINAAAADLRPLAPELILSVQHPDLFRREILGLPARGCINLHFGRLPEYRGCYPLIWPILNGDADAGATLHLMDEGFDTGAVVGVARVAIRPDETARELYDRVADAAFDLLVRELPAIAAGTHPARPQIPDTGRYYAKDSIDFQRDRIVDWQRPAREIHARIRAFTFPPFQLPAVRAGAAIVDAWDSLIVNAPSTAKPGTVLGLASDRLLIAAAGGAVALKHLRGPDGVMRDPADAIRNAVLSVGQRLS